MHTHHKNGNKLINRKENLECLCVLCHANTDENHKQNFDKNRMQIELTSFVEKYRQQLTEIVNKYI